MTDDEQGKSWFLVQLKPNCARIAERNLRRQGYDTFFPLEEVTTKRRGKFVSAVRGLFPGYMFVAVDSANGPWVSVNSTYGVARLVQFGNGPAHVPDDLVYSLMAQTDAAGKLLPDHGLKEGDRVAITQGPFANLVALVTAVAPDRRVFVLLDIMGRDTRVAINSDKLRMR